MKIKIVILMISIFCGLSAGAQMAKCKGKYFGCVIGKTVPSTYGGLWNQVTPENGTKWGIVEATKGVYDWTEADVSYNWAKKNGALFKYHTFVWGSQMPDWVKTATTAELTASVENLMKAAAAHFNPMGGLAFIEVMNEPANPVLPDFMKAALTAGYKAEPANAKDLNNPYGWLIWPYQLARKYFPNAILTTNDYNIEQNWNGMRAPYIKAINAVKAAPNITNGAKNLINGLGLQCHGVQDLTVANFKACLDEMWAGTGLPIHITEFDQWADPNEAKQLAVYSSLIPVAWEHPHVAGITIWGYVQGTTWRNGNGVAGPTGTDTGLQYADTYTANPNGDRPALKWLKQYFASKTNLYCCPAAAPMATCIPPTVSLTAPTAASLFPTTATINLSANASDADGSITSVSFYRGTTLIATVTAAPYTFAWKGNLPAGTFKITAVATDNNGIKTTSSAASITIVTPINYIYQCNACPNPTWTTPANWTPAVVPAYYDSASIRTGEVKVSYNIATVTKVEPNGTFRLMDSIWVGDLRLQGGTLKSFTSTPVFILTSNITAETASTILAGSLTTSTFRIDGTIKGNGNLTKTGIGVLQINAWGTNYKGTWIVQAGKLKLRNYTGLGQCGVEVDSGANLDIEATTSINHLFLKQGGTLNLDASMTVQTAVFNNINIPSGTYTAANYPAFISGAGTLTVAKTLLMVSPPVAGSIRLTADNGATYNWLNKNTSIATGTTYTPTTTGTYSLKATTAAGCTATSAPVLMQAVALAKGWNLISTNLRVSDSSIATLFNGLDVLAIKDMNHFWCKDQADVFNDLKTITAGNAYLVSMNTAEKLMIAGTPVQTRFIASLPSANWSLIGCPYQTTTPFSQDFNTTNSTLIKNFDGFWIPNGTANSLQNFEPGNAYFIKK